jgi:hypothetical protein
VFQRLGTEAFELEVRLPPVAVLQQPTAVCPLLAADDVDRLGEAPVARRADVSEVIERAENVVVPPRREGEAGKGGLDDRARTVGAEQPMSGEELPAAALRGLDRPRVVRDAIRSVGGPRAR